ncbi:MAG: hypothetical protein IJ246_08780 [Clostridia bacterium]|nr:hypothetical protein [Clostridia bacterium]
MPKWFARLFAVVMLLACGATAYFVYQHEKLSYAVEDARVSLETSRARERKQEYEWDQVSQAIPKAEEELSLLQPQVDDLLASLTDLRQTRTALDEANTVLTESVTHTQTQVSSLTDSLYLRMDALEEQTEDTENALTQALDQLLQRRTAPYPSIP